MTNQTINQYSSNIIAMPIGNSESLDRTSIYNDQIQDQIIRLASHHNNNFEPRQVYRRILPSSFHPLNYGSHILKKTRSFITGHAFRSKVKAKIPDALKNLPPHFRAHAAPNDVQPYQLIGLHSLFPEKHRHLSPVYSLINAQNELIESHLIETSPSINPQHNNDIFKLLFIRITKDNEIVPTHLGANPASHLKASTLGKLVAAIEKYSISKKNKNADFSMSNTALAETLLDIIKNDESFKKSCSESQHKADQAKDNRNDLQKRFEDDQIIKNSKDELNEKIKVQKRQLKNIDRLINKREACKSDRTPFTKKITELETELKTIPKTSLSKKVYSKSIRELNNTIEKNDTQTESFNKTLNTFVENLAKSASFPFENISKSDKQMGSRSVAIPALQAFLWKISESTSDIEAYITPLDHAGFIKHSKWEKKRNALLAQTGSDIQPSHHHFVKKFNLTWNKPRFIDKHLDHTTSLLMEGRLKESKTAPVIPFNFFVWAQYSTYPDCVENSLRNFFNQLLYDPNTGTFDAERLNTLKTSKIMPNIHDKLIEFYQTYNTPSNMKSIEAKAAWIKTVSNLNALNLNAPEVKYRKNGQDHVASPLSNLINTAARLMGIEQDSDQEMSQKNSHIHDYERMLTITAAFNTLSESEITADISGINEEGFGKLILTVDNESFTLSSPPPVHINFSKNSSQDNRKVIDRISKAFLKSSYKKFQHAKSENSRQAALAELFLFKQNGYGGSQRTIQEPSNQDNLGDRE